MKYIFTFCLICFVAVFASAQKENTAFLEKAMLNWLENEINNVELAIVTAQNAFTSKDVTKMGSSNSRLQIGLKNMYENTDVLLQQIVNDRKILVDSIQKNDMIQGLFHFNRKKSQKRLQEVFIEDTTENEIEAEVKLIAAKFNAIKQRNLEFFPTDTHTSANLKDADKILSSTKKVNQLLQKGVVSE